MLIMHNFAHRLINFKKINKEIYKNSLEMHNFIWSFKKLIMSLFINNNRHIHAYNYILNCFFKISY